LDEVTVNAVNLFAEKGLRTLMFAKKEFIDIDSFKDISDDSKHE
jgi:magnesium-transporting ATPase (P-type)